jgi:DNA-binding transcriptional LysR family regulator
VRGNPSGQADIVITPREAFTGYRSFCNTFLYSDRLLCAVDADNEAVGETLSLEQFSSLPYLATTCERSQATAEAQLDRLGIPRNTEFAATFGMVPSLLSGSRMIALVHERLALALADQTTLRLLEPPMPLQPVHLLMLWTNSADADFGHGWLRQRILSLVADGLPAGARGCGAGSNPPDDRVGGSVQLDDRPTNVRGVASVTSCHDRTVVPDATSNAQIALRRDAAN